LHVELDEQPVELLEVMAAGEETAARGHREVALEKAVLLGRQPGQGRADGIAMGVVGSGEENQEAGLAHGAGSIQDRHSGLTSDGYLGIVKLPVTTEIPGRTRPQLRGLLVTSV